VWVRSGDFKLLRWFGNPARMSSTTCTRTGEANDLATTMPEKVKELDALIDGFLKDTGALYPRPNPAYKPVAAKSACKRLIRSTTGRNVAARRRWRTAF
jgi:hypothetical protein